MSINFPALWLGTFAMLFLSVVIIFFILWAASMFSKMKQRDVVRDERLDKIETIMKDKFEVILNILNK